MPPDESKKWLLRASLDGPLDECVPTLFLFPLLTFAQSTPQGTALVPAFALEDGTPIKLSSFGRHPLQRPLANLIVSWRRGLLRALI